MARKATKIVPGRRVSFKDFKGMHHFGTVLDFCDDVTIRVIDTTSHIADGLDDNGSRLAQMYVVDLADASLL